VSIGDALTAARRQAGLTIAQVSQRTCIRETIVRGIERGDYSACGGDFYARGHIRSIARAVGLEPEELIREYDETQAPPQPITAADVFQPFTPVKLKERRRPNWSIVLLAGLVAVLGIVGFRYFHNHGSTQPGKTTAASAHAPHTTAKPHTTPAAATPTRVRLTLMAAPGSVTWAEATSASGKLLFQGDVSSAAKMSWVESEPITLRLGNPGGALLYLDGTRQHFSDTTQPITVVCSLTACTTTAPGT